MTTLEQSGTGAGAGSALLSDGRIGTAVGAAVDWVTSTDHKKIGRLFTGFGILGMIAVSVIAVLRSLESVADLGAFNAQQLDQLTQLHHFGLALMVALPLTLGLSIAVAPMQVGARAIAFARLALMGFYMWLAGAVLTIVAIVNGGGIGGADSDMVDLFLAAMALMMFGVIASAISVATTILTSRAPGVTMRRVPFLTWTALVQSLALIITAPVVVGLIIYLFVDHRNSALAFGAADGLADWLPRFFTAPVVYIFAIPALGVFAELLPVSMSRRHPMRQLVFTGAALVGVASFAGVTMQKAFPVDFSESGQDVVKSLVVMAFFVGLPLLGIAITLLTSLLVAKPDGSGAPKPRILSPLLFGLLSILLILLGAVVGVLTQIVDLELSGTAAVEGTVALICLAAALGTLGGLVFWAPKFSGTKPDEKKVLPLALLGALGVVLAGVPGVIAGLADSDSSLFSTLTLIGYALMALTGLAFVGATRGGISDGTNNPWCAHTLEWSTTCPAPADNYEALATVRSAEPELDQLPEGSPS